MPAFFMLFSYPHNSSKTTSEEFSGHSFQGHRLAPWQTPLKRVPELPGYGVARAIVIAGDVSTSVQQAQDSIRWVAYVQLERDSEKSWTRSSLVVEALFPSPSWYVYGSIALALWF